MSDRWNNVESVDTCGVERQLGFRRPNGLEDESDLPNDEAFQRFNECEWVSSKQSTNPSNLARGFADYYQHQWIRGIAQYRTVRMANHQRG